MRRGKIFPHLFLALLFTVCIDAQDLPSKLRDYIVYGAKITVTQSARSVAVPDSDASITLGEPTLKEISPLGITVNISGEIIVRAQSGKVDFLTFHEIKVNGINVDLDEYRESFNFKKGKPVVLPKPTTIFIPTARLLQAAHKEMRDPKKKWTITGRVFVFGKFRKYGFDHKRVVPLEINLITQKSAKSLKTIRAYQIPN